MDMINKYSITMDIYVVPADLMGLSHSLSVYREKFKRLMCIHVTKVSAQFMCNQQFRGKN